MKAKDLNAYNKYMILRHGLEGNNVSETCKLFGISRTTYYNWYKAYQDHGIEGLELKEPQKPNMPNKVNKTNEQEILAYVTRYPTDGPKRIYYELKAEGINIGESGIYNVLKRYQLTKKAQRVAFSKVKHFNNKTKKRIHPNLEDLRDSYPGFLVIQRIDYIGTFDGIGKIYQYSFYDTFSKWGVVRLYNKKQDIDVWYYFEQKLVYLMKTLNLSIENLITVKNKEFVPCFVKGNKYKEIIEGLNINHRFFEPNSHSILAEMDEFIKLLETEFYDGIAKDNHLDSFIKIERELHKFMRYYNFSKEISFGCNVGKVPAKVILDRAIDNNVDPLPLWLLTLLNLFKRGDEHE